MNGFDPQGASGEDPKEALKRLARMLRDVGFGPHSSLTRLLGQIPGMEGMLPGFGGMFVPPIGGGGGSIPGIPGGPGAPGFPGLPGVPGPGGGSGGSGGSGGTGCAGGQCYDDSPPEL